MKKDIEWLKEEIEEDIKSWGGGNPDYFRGASDAYENVKDWLNQLDKPETLSQNFIDEHTQRVTGFGADKNGIDQYHDAHFVSVCDLQNLLVPKQEEVDRAYRKGFKEGERQTAEYFESITEEPSKEQVWKYLSEHGIEVVDKEPETVADVVADFFKSLERLKEVMSMEVEELEK